MSKAFEDWWTNGEVRYFEQDNHVALKDAFEAGRAVGRKEASTPPTYAHTCECQGYHDGACTCEEGTDFVARPVDN